MRLLVATTNPGKLQEIRLALDGAALVKLGQQLKAACGSGGTVKDGVIEVQGDHADKIVALLVAQGHAAKRAGG